MFERKLHAVQSKLMEEAPFHRAWTRVHDNAISFKGETLIQKRGVSAAVVENDSGIGIETFQIPHKVNDAFVALVNQTGKDVTNRANLSGGRHVASVGRHGCHRLRCSRARVTTVASLAIL